MAELKKQFSQEITDYLAIALGLACYAVGWTLFLLPYGITTGGVTGVAAIIFYATGFEMQISYMLINAFLLLFALKILGWRFCAKTVYAVALLTIFLKVGQMLMDDGNGGFIQILGENESFMATVIGAALGGIGVGICFSHNGSTGGTDIIAAMVNKYKDISLGRLILLTDMLIIGSSYFVFHDIRRMMFGYVSMFILSVALDYYVNSARQSVQLLIFSHKYEEIADYINTVIHRGVTVLDGMGWYSKNERKVLVVMAKKRDAVNLLQAIKQIDPGAFISQSNVVGVYGQGFDKIKGK